MALAVAVAGFLWPKAIAYPAAVAAAIAAVAMTARAMRAR
jgi:hypothetical protein